MFFKTEGHGNGLKKAVSTELTSGWVMQDKYLQQTTNAVEGSGIFKLIGSDEYILMYDVYMNGRYDFTRSTDLENFTLIEKEKVSMNFHPRHGTVIPITAKEAKALEKKWGAAKKVKKVKGNNPALKGLYADPDIISEGITGWL